MNNYELEIECNEDLETGTLELILEDCDLDLIMDPVKFYWSVIENLNYDYNVNGLRPEDGATYLYVDTYSAVYDGAFVTNACYRNAIFDLRNTGRAVLHAVTDPDDIEDIKTNWLS
jgi:hypothetical protein